MAGSVLAAQAAEFDERNLFMLFVLGLLSLGERLDALVREHAPAPAAHRAAAALDDDPSLYLLLGAVKMRGVVRDELAAAAPAPVPSPAGRPEPRTRSPRDGLLR